MVDKGAPCNRKTMFLFHLSDDGGHTLSLKAFLVPVFHFPIVAGAEEKDEV